jgi:hypothetical protein
MNIESVNIVDSQAISKPSQSPVSIVQMHYIQKTVRENQDDPL